MSNILTVDQMKGELCMNDIESLRPVDLYNVFMEGCIGYNNMTDNEIKELYQEHIENPEQK